MQHQTVILKEYLLQWNKPIRILNEVTKLRDMILNGEMWRRGNHNMTGIWWCFSVQISQISESDQSQCVFSFSYINYFAFGPPRRSVRSVKNQRVIHGSTQCFIENNNGNLALGFEQCVELFLFKSVDKSMDYLCVWFKLKIKIV